MREIKFRVWSEQRKEMLDIQRHSFKTNKSMPYGWNMQYEFDALMQYTGLKDINGVEVYEGDIVVPTYYMDGMEELRTELEQGVVVWDEYETCFTIKGHEPNTLGCFEEVEVLGNIYENPELLLEDFYDK